MLLLTRTLSPEGFATLYILGHICSSEAVAPQVQDCPDRLKAVREDKILSPGVCLLILSRLRDCTAYLLRSLGEEHPHQGNLGWVRQ